MYTSWLPSMYTKARTALVCRILMLTWSFGPLLYGLSKGLWDVTGGLASHGFPRTLTPPLSGRRLNRRADQAMVSSPSTGPRPAFLLLANVSSRRPPSWIIQKTIVSKTVLGSIGLTVELLRDAEWTGQLGIHA